MSDYTNHLCPDFRNVASCLCCIVNHMNVSSFATVKGSIDNQLKPEPSGTGSYNMAQKRICIQSCRRAIQVEVSTWYFPVVLFPMPNKMVLTSAFLDESSSVNIQEKVRVTYFNS